MVIELMKEGDAGPEIKKLQQKLKKAGFNPGALDGEFGPATEAALLAFQRSSGLLADGIAGPRTLVSLDLLAAKDLPSIVDKVTPLMVSRMFPFTQTDPIKKNLPAVLGALKEADLDDKSMVLMALATIRAESEGFVPIQEFKSRFNTSPGGHPYDLYDNRSDLGNRGRPDGESFCGRGFIQLTGRSNYERIGKKIGLGNGLVDDPGKANDPAIASKILAAFLKAKEMDIREDLLEDNLRAARRAVNGGSHGLDRFTDAYRRGQAAIPDA